MSDWKTWLRDNSRDTIKSSKLPIKGDLDQLSSIVKTTIKDRSPSFPFKWNREKFYPLAQEVMSLNCLNDWVIPKHLDVEMQIELLKFKSVLLWYEERYPNAIFSPKEILYRSLAEGPAFNVFLADQRKHSARVTTSLLEEHLLSDYLPFESKIDEIFDPMCLIRWELPDEEEWKISLEEPPTIKEDLLLEYEIFLDSLKYDNIPKRDLLNDLNYLRGTKVYDIKTRKTKNNYLVHSELKQLKMTNQFIFKRSLVWKNAAETRDCVVATVETLHTISECGRFIGEIAKRLYPEEYKMVKRDNYLELKSLGKNKKLIYMMTDIKKCGFTIPRSLILKTLEVLSKKYENEAIKLTFEAYHNIILHVNDKEYIPKNGIMLGMLNELVTFIMINLFKMAQFRGIIPDSAKGWFLNDDQLIFWESESDDQKIILERWKDYLLSYGYIVHMEKPFISRNGQFCEQWTNHFGHKNMEKTLRQYWVTLNFFDAYNIIDAKRRFSQNFMKWWGLSIEDYDKALYAALSFWGFEFQKDEYLYPIQFGGWVRNIKDFLDQSLYMASKKEVPIPLQRVYFLVKEVKLIDLLDKKIKIKDPYIFKIIRNDDEDKFVMSLKNKVTKLVEQTMIESRLFNKGYTKDILISKYFNKLYDLRQKAYKSQVKFEEFNWEIKDDWNNYRIPLTLIKVKNFDYSPLCDLRFKYPKSIDLERLHNSFSDLYAIRPPERFESEIHYLGFKISEWQWNELIGLTYPRQFILRNLLKLIRFSPYLLSLVNQLSEDLDLTTCELCIDHDPTFLEILKMRDIPFKENQIWYPYKESLIIPIDISKLENREFISEYEINKLCLEYICKSEVHDDYCASFEDIVDNYIKDVKDNFNKEYLKWVYIPHLENTFKESHSEILDEKDIIQNNLNEYLMATMRSVVFQLGLSTTDYSQERNLQIQLDDEYIDALDQDDQGGFLNLFDDD